MMQSQKRTVRSDSLGCISHVLHISLVFGESYSSFHSPGNKHVGLNIERIKYWLSVGAQPSTAVGRLLSQAGVIPRGLPTPLGFQTVKNPDKWARKEAPEPAEDKANEEQ